YVVPAEVIEYCSFASDEFAETETPGEHRRIAQNKEQPHIDGHTRRSNDHKPDEFFGGQRGQPQAGELQQRLDVKSPAPLPFALSALTKNVSNFADAVDIASPDNFEQNFVAERLQFRRGNCRPPNKKASAHRIAQSTENIRQNHQAD